MGARRYRRTSSRTSAHRLGLLRPIAAGGNLHAALSRLGGVRIIAQLRCLETQLMLSRRLFVLSSLAFATPALAHSYNAGDIAIGHVWALPSVSGETRVFFPL